MGMLFVLTCLLGFTINMTDALTETLTMIVIFLSFRAKFLIAFYVTARLFLAALHLMFAALLKHMRPILIALACVNACAASIWIGSIYVELPQRYAMLWVAIALGKIRL